MLLRTNTRQRQANNRTYKRVVFICKCDHCGVERQALFADGFAADFFIRPINVYVQVDGVYWHGVNRTFKELQDSNTPRDKQILVTKRNDEQQNGFYTKRPDDGSVLLRISDVYVRRCGDELARSLEELLIKARNNVLHIEY